MKKISSGHIAIIIIICILVIDQVIKIMVKTNMCLHESIQVTNWFYINFIENNGMAYGMTFVNKFVLSLFRIVAVCVLGYYIWIEVRKKARTGYIVCVSMVLAGAAGNIFDSMFYGLIFSASSPFYVSYFVPFGEGYAPFLMGKVVDMFYFPLIETTLPDWLPIWGGQPYVFFSPVFNFADASITTGVALLLLFYRKELSTISFKKVSSQSVKSDEDPS
ncbi:MAG: lipoprotein signal peptidase [Prevotella sp.]|nr:lipoprotein signal peptidase [Prevotella sp.]MBR1462681.1 lipoprotein signal peptidase [Prevotella sp.]